jgi:hypothetical protein
MGRNLAKGMVFEGLRTEHVVSFQAVASSADGAKRLEEVVF